jgi:hypothetical protein
LISIFKNASQGVWRTFMDNKYNGWSNYETWNFKLWLDNDETTHKFVINKIKEIRSKFSNDDWKDFVITREKAYRLASDFLRSYIEDNAPELEISKNGYYSDILNAGLRVINTYEIAQSYFEDLELDKWWLRSA